MLPAALAFNAPSCRAGRAASAAKCPRCCVSCCCPPCCLGVAAGGVTAGEGSGRFSANEGEPCSCGCSSWSPAAGRGGARPGSKRGTAAARALPAPLLPRLGDRSPSTLRCCEGEAAAGLPARAPAVPGSGLTHSPPAALLPSPRLPALPSWLTASGGGRPPSCAAPPPRWRAVGGASRGVTSRLMGAAASSSSGDSGGAPPCAVASAAAAAAGVPPAALRGKACPPRGVMLSCCCCCVCCASSTALAVGPRSPRGAAGVTSPNAGAAAAAPYRDAGPVSGVTASAGAAAVARLPAGRELGVRWVAAGGASAATTRLLLACCKGHAADAAAPVPSAGMAPEPAPGAEACCPMMPAPRQRARQTAYVASHAVEPSRWHIWATSQSQSVGWLQACNPSGAAAVKTAAAAHARRRDPAGQQHAQHTLQASAVVAVPSSTDQIYLLCWRRPRLLQSWPGCGSQPRARLLLPAAPGRRQWQLQPAGWQTRGRRRRAAATGSGSGAASAGWRRARPAGAASSLAGGCCGGHTASQRRLQAKASRGCWSATGETRQRRHIHACTGSRAGAPPLSIAPGTPGTGPWRRPPAVPTPSMLWSSLTIRAVAGAPTGVALTCPRPDLRSCKRRRARARVGRADRHGRAGGRGGREARCVPPHCGVVGAILTAQRQAIRRHSPLACAPAGTRCRRPQRCTASPGAGGQS